jgi:Protein of unknown function (DUF2806)
LANDPENASLPELVELGVGMLPEPWREKFYQTLLRFAGRRVAPELVKALTEEADAARGRAILSDAIAAAGAEVLSTKIKTNPELAALAIARSIDDHIDRQQNLNDILRLASAQVAEDATPGEPPPDEKIAEDWRRKFTSFAEDISDQQMQTVWARILAGEFRQPGTFSYRTLRLVSELSPVIAATFEKFSDQVITGDALVTLRAEWNEGENFMAAKALEDWGILQDPPYASARIALKQSGDLYVVPNGKFVAVLKIPDGPERLSFSIAFLSEPGRQLFQLLPKKDERPILRKILMNLVEANPNSEWARIVLADGRTMIESVYER